MEYDTPTHNRALFLVWLRNNFPHLYNEATQSSAVGGFFDSIGSAFSNVVDKVTTALPNLANTYAQYRQQEQLIKMNAQRANQGLPPLIYQNGQLVDMTGQPYSQNDWDLASTGGLSTTSVIMIVAAVVLGSILIFKR